MRCTHCKTKFTTPDINLDKVIFIACPECNRFAGWKCFVPGLIYPEEAFFTDEELEVFWDEYNEDNVITIECKAIES